MNHLLWIILISLASSIQCEEFVLNYNYYGTNEGLSNRNVQCQHSDKQGLLWFGTKYGINRFDGKQFKWYTQKTHQLQSNEINHIEEDKNGFLWFIHTGFYFDEHVKFIDIYNPNSDTFQSFETFFKEENPFDPKDIQCFDIKENGEFVFLTKQNNLITYNGVFDSVAIPLDKNQNVLDVFYINDNQICITIEKNDFTIEVWSFTMKGDLMFHKLFNNAKELILYDWEEDDGGKGYFTNTINNRVEFFHLSSDGVRSIDQSTNEFIVRNGLEESEFTILNPIIKQNNTFLISTMKDNLFVLNKEHPFTIKNPETLHNIKDITAVDLYDDQRLVISSQFGVRIVNINKELFKNVLKGTKNNPRRIRGINKDVHGDVWVVEEGYNSLWRLDFNDLNESITVTNHENDFSFSKGIVAILNDSKGYLYYVDDQLHRINTTTLHHEKFIIGEKDKDWGYIWSLFEDREGNIWFGSDKGNVGYWNGNNVSWLPSLSQTEELLHIYQFIEAADGLVWLATEKGIYTLDIERKKIIDRYWSEGIKEYFLPFDNVHHISIDTFNNDKDNILWLGTKEDGLVQWEPKGDYRQFTRADGLTDNTIYAVYPDAHENLWLTSDYGIIKFNRLNFHTQSYIQSNGITHNEFNRIAHFRNDDGTLFFGGLDGITTFHPEDVIGDLTSTNVPLVVTDFELFGSDGKKKQDQKEELLKNNRIRIEPNDRFFRIEFALLEYENTDNIQYAFKISTLDESWHFQKENQIQYSRLPYGINTLRIKGQSSDGLWSNQELVIEIDVIRPFYLNAIFIIGCFFLVLFGVLLLYNWNNRQLIKQKEALEKEIQVRTKTITKQTDELKELEKTKSRFFANVSHELKTPLTLMIGPISSLLRQDYWSEKDRRLLNFVQKNNKYLLQLVNELLDIAKLESGKLEINETEIDLLEFIKPIIAQFNSYIESGVSRIDFIYSGNHSIKIYLDSRKIEKIIYNFLSNAIKFSPNIFVVSLHVEEKEHTILVSVKDNGMGIHLNDLPFVFDRFYQSKTYGKQYTGTGIGLAYSKELAELLNGKVWVKSILGEGSTFYLEIPKSR